MDSTSEYSYRLGKNELIVAAPCDDAHKKAFSSLAPGSIFDDLLEEWRIPWNGQDPEDLIDEIKEAVDRLKDQSLTSQVADVSGLLYGYAQTTKGEGGEKQVDALREFGIPDGRIYYDKLSGRYPALPKLVECLNRLRSGDTLVVFSLNRLARSLKHLTETAEIIQKKNAHIRSLAEGIDTRSPRYEHFLSHLIFVGAFEKEANSARTKAGIKEAVAKGRNPPGRRSVLTREKLEVIAKLILNGMAISEVAKLVETSRATVYRAFPGGPRAIIEANKKHGQQGINRLIDAAELRINTGLTNEKREEIIRLHKRRKTLNFIVDQTGFSRETIRAVIASAY
ncbi:MAG: recombinase family protein [Proteobacteria bacterium]|nr:recombinase family protein [Pseudomonadota bacterium]